jgi:Domain of unknown function (DUF5666)
MVRYKLLAAIGIAGLSVAACGSSNGGSTAASSAPGTVAPTATSAAAAPAPGPGPMGRDHVAGQIASVSGSTISVTQPGGTGTATVAFAPATTISEAMSAQLTDVTAGSCVMIRPARDGGAPGNGAITAARVLVSDAVNGQCGPAGGRPAGGTTSAAPGQPPRGRGLRGTVASVSGNTIVVTTASDGGTAPTTVDVNADTRYMKRAVVNAQAITQGECIAARGSKDGSGTLQATMINLRASNNGNCPQPKGDHPHPGG